MNVLIREEALADQQAVWELNCDAFANEAEANLVDALRAGGLDTVSLVAVHDAKIVGHILFSPIQIETASGSVAALALAPMAVAPTCQRQGIGSRLVAEGLEACRRQGHAVVTVLGHPAFYPKFGFSAELAKSLECPFGTGEAWMALELIPSALSGVRGRVVYSEPFRAFE